jgi:hypothetical protein
MIRNRVYFAGDRPAELWQMRANHTPVAMRRALGRAIKLLSYERIVQMVDTIYMRGEKPRGRFTYRLRNSEVVYFRGTTASVGNVAKSRKGYAYAQKRHDAKGYSKKYKMRKESQFATKALKNTARERNEIIRDALRETNRRK